MGSRILLVDDELEICRSLRRLLRRTNLDIVFTTNPNQALEMVRTEHWHVVISDYRMPEMLGTDLLSEIARLSPGTLRLMLSACAEIDTLAANYDESRIHRFIRKPWNDLEFTNNLVALMVNKGTTPSSPSLTAAALEASQQRVW